MRALLLPAFLALSLGIAVGCGGHHSSEDCTDSLTLNGEDNSVYAGNYTATFTPDDGSARNTFTATFKALGNGFVQGTVSDSGSSTGTTPLGFNSIVAKGKCEGGKTYFRFVFQRSVDTVAGVAEELDVKTDTLDSLSGVSVKGTLSTTNDANTAAVEVPGTLAITAVAAG